MENGILKFELGSEIIPGLRLTGDGMTGGIEFEHWRDGPAAAATKSIARFAGVPQASQAFFEFPVILGRAVQNRNLAAEASKNLDYAHGVKKFSTINPGTGEFKTLSNSYVKYATPCVWFLVRGDLDYLRRLYRSVHFIGSMRKRGFGEVRSFEIMEQKSDNECFGIIGDGCPLRPIPSRLRSEFPPITGSSVEKMETWQSPYHWTDRAELCVVPAVDYEPVDLDQLQRYAA